MNLGLWATLDERDMGKLKVRKKSATFQLAFLLAIKRKLVPRDFRQRVAGSGTRQGHVVPDLHGHFPRRVLLYRRWIYNERIAYYSPLRLGRQNASFCILNLGLLKEIRAS